MPFGAAGLTAAVAVGGAVFSATGFGSVLSADLALSDSAACWAGACARNGEIVTGIISANPAAHAIGHIDNQKG
jgi:hypothetical protein